MVFECRLIKVKTTIEEVDHVDISQNKSTSVHNSRRNILTDHESFAQWNLFLDQEWYNFPDIYKNNINGIRDSLTQFEMLVVKFKKDIQISNILLYHLVSGNRFVKILYILFT